MNDITPERYACAVEFIAEGIEKAFFFDFGNKEDSDAYHAINRACANILANRVAMRYFNMEDARQIASDITDILIDNYDTCNRVEDK